MRKEPFTKGDIVHVFNRGNRKQEIVRDEDDRVNFLLALYYLNNRDSVNKPLARVRSILNLRSNLRFEWPPDWKPREDVVDVLAFTLMDNHLHLALHEKEEGGVSEFMRKIGNSMTGYFNEKYGEEGRLFQSSYKLRRVDEDTYLQYLAVYIHVKNVFELYPGGFEKALENFDDAFEFAAKHPYSSLGAYFSKEHVGYPIVNTEMLRKVINNKKDFKELAKNCIEFVHFDDKKTKILGQT